MAWYNSSSDAPSLDFEVNNYPTSSGASSFDGASVGPLMSVVGAVQSGFGAYFTAQSAQRNLEFQADMGTINARIGEINARMAENTAQSIMRAAEQSEGQIGLRAGKAKGSQRASQGARGVVAGVGNAAEEIATTDLMKETDILTINANATRAAWGARMGGVNAMTGVVNAQNDALVKRATAEGISPYSAAATSLIGSAATVANSWYGNSTQRKLARALGADV